MKVEPITAPGTGDEPLTLDDAYEHLRIVPDDSPPASVEDLWLQAAIQGVRASAEDFTGLSLAKKKYRMYLDRFPTAHFWGAPCVMEIPFPPLLTVDSITYTDSAGVVQSLGTGDFDIDYSHTLPRVESVEGWPADAKRGSVVVDFTSGYVRANFPPQIRTGLLLLLGHYYKNREMVVASDLVEIPLGIQWLFRPSRINKGMA